MPKQKIRNKENPHLTRCPLPKSLAFRDQINKRIDLITEEFEEGFKFLFGLKNEVSIFGSARFKEGDKYYDLARELGKKLGKNGYSIITGGGPGIMEAGNRGAQEAGARSVGLNIELPMEQRINPYVDKSMGFHYFFSRKVMLSASAQAYIVFPGGFGTIDELFELITLIQTGKMKRVPIILFGEDFWSDLVKFIEKKLSRDFKTISQEDMKIFTLTDSIDEVIEIVRGTESREIF